MNSVSDSQIAEWKKSFGSIYSGVIAGTEYIFRALLYKEYDALPTALSSAEGEDYVVSCTLLYPRELAFDELPAGAVSELAEHILNVSGLGLPSIAKGMLEAQRDKAQEVRGLMKAFVLATMPAYTEEQLDCFSFGQLAGKVALAEQIIQVRQAMFPAAVGVEGATVTLDLIDPMEEAAKQAELDRKKKEQYERQMERMGQDPDQAPPLRQHIRQDDPIVQRLKQALS